GLVTQIIGVIDRARENRLPRLLDDAVSVWRAEAIRGPRHKRFNFSDVSTRHAVELSELDHPDTGNLHRGVFRPECRDLVRKPRLCQGFKSSGFAQTLAAFEDQHTVSFTSWQVHAGDSRDQPLCGDRPHIGGVPGSEVPDGPRVKAALSVPLTAAQ